MADKLQITPTGALQPVQPTQIAYTQTGNDNTQIGHVDNYNDESVTNVVMINNQQTGQPARQNALNKEYYSLIVSGGEIFTAFANGYVMVDKRRALTEEVSPDIKDAVNTLHARAIEFVKTLPTIFADENTVYGKSDDTQMAFFGMVTDVRVQDNGIKVFYQLLNPLPQKRLNEIIDKLAIRGTSNFNELDRTHWTIKRIDLVAELREAGITVYAP